MLVEAPKSTKRLCKFLLKISKVRRNGGVWDLDLPPIKAMSAGSIFFKEVLGGLPISWVTCEITAAGRGEVGTALISLRSSFH